MNQYEAVQEFGRVLLNEESSSPRLIAFFEMLARHTPKLRSVRMTNVLHALWHVVPDDALFDILTGSIIYRMLFSNLENDDRMVDEICNIVVGGVLEARA